MKLNTLDKFKLNKPMEDLVINHLIPKLQKHKRYSEMFCFAIDHGQAKAKCEAHGIPYIMVDNLISLFSLKDYNDLLAFDALMYGGKMGKTFVVLPH